MCHQPLHASLQNRSVGAHLIRRRGIALFVSQIIDPGVKKLAAGRKKEKQSLIVRRSATSYARHNLKPQEALISHEVTNIFLLIPALLLPLSS